MLSRVAGGQHQSPTFMVNREGDQHRIRNVTYFTGLTPHSDSDCVIHGRAGVKTVQSPNRWSMAVRELHTCIPG